MTQNKVEHRATCNVLPKMVFVQPGEKVDSSYNCDNVLEQGLSTDIEHCLVWFTRFSKMAHRSRKSVDFLRPRVPAFTEPENWSPNSPDLNPVDYSIWDALERLVWQRIRDVDQLKDVFGSVLGTNQPGFYWSSNRFRKRLVSTIALKGGQVEHFLNYWT